jgi:DNA-directed RNA polymerase subunit RPC12/RpoP
MHGEKYWEITKKDWYQTALIIILVITTLVLFSILLLPDYWYFWLLVVAAAMALLVAWHAKNFAYICPKCGELFEVSALDDFLGPNSLNKKYLKCPKCSKRAWAEILKIKE